MHLLAVASQQSCGSSRGQNSSPLRAKPLCLAVTLLSLCGAVAADFTPEVLQVFSVETATGSTGEPVGARPHTPPVFNPVDGRLYGVTPSGGLSGVYSTQYHFTPDADISDYEGISSELNVIAGFYTGLVVNSAGMVFGGANPLMGDGLLFQWTSTDGMSDAFPAIDTDAAYGSAFKLRGLPAIDADDNVYFGGGSGRAGMALFRRSASGDLTQLVDFSLAEYVEGTGSSSVYLKGQYPAAVIFSEQDQAVYGITVQTQSAGAGDPDSVPDGDEAAGTLIRVYKTDFATDGSSQVEVLHTFARNAEGAVLGSDSGQHSLVEAGNWLYGTTDKAIWRIKKDDPDSFTLLHTFGSGESVAADIDGNTPHGPLVLADDGNIYGTTETSFTDSSTAQAGTLFRINIGSESDRSDDSYEQLHQFDIETQGAWPVGLVSGPSADGIHTLYGATERGGNPGDVFSTTDPDGLGTVYSVQVEIPGTLVLTSDKTEISYGESVVLTWEGLYLDTCEAVNEWEGEKAVNGTETLTPDQVGQSTYNLDCLDVHGNEVTAAVQVQVNEVEDDDTSTGDDTADDDSDNGSSGGGGSMSSLAILLLGVISLFGRFRHQRSVARA